MKNINLKNTLIAEIIQLFATMASADGKVSENEKEFIRNYFQSLYPVSFANLLYGEFEKAVQSGINTDVLLSNINNRLNHDDKIFLVVKLIELMATDSIDDTERKVLNTIAEKFHIPAEHLSFLVSLLTNNDAGNLSHSTGPFHYITVSGENEQADVQLPFPGLRLTIINIGKSLIIFRNSSKHEVLLNDKPLIKHFTIRIPKNGHLNINNSYEILYQDLQYYFKNLETPISAFYLSERQKDLDISLSPKDEDCVLCERENCKIYLTPLNSRRIKINGHFIHDRTTVNFDDQVYCNHFSINMRTLVYQRLSSISEVTRLSRDNIRKLTIGNHLESTIHIEDEIDELWNCAIELNKKSYYIDIAECPYPVYINGKRITRKTKIDVDDRIMIRNAVISFNRKKRAFEKKDSGIHSFEAQGLNYRFSDKTYGVHNVSFTSKRGEMIAIMGTSGCGKSTLLNVLNGFYKPQEGKVVADNYDIHQNVDLLSNYMSYVPQYDLLLENLTVYENLWYNARLRFPGSEKNCKAIVNRVLNDIGLYDKRDVKVGDPLHKTLSGGERKRVNIGLELLADTNIILLDEPTSGLSSKDSERILKLLRNLTYQGKIIYVVIHQPSMKLYEMFNKLILLDKGGRLVYFGSPFSALDYFRKYSGKSGSGREEQILVDPDFLLDTIEQPIPDIDGTPLPIRKYSPEFWQEAYMKHLEEMSKKEKEEKSGSFLIKPKRSLTDRLSIALTLLQRNFVNKLRDRSNLIITFLLPPLLGLFVGAILHYSPGEQYTFFENKHIGTFLFLSMLIAIFLGVTNSVEEIIKDQHILLREKMLRISNLSYFNSKILTLLPFAVIQNLLFVYVGYSILGGKEFYLVYVILLTIISFCGISIGLFISSIPGLTTKAAVNIIPVILIPQIIFGGALIQYQEMNKQLVFDTRSPIPEICQLMPSRWGFESLVTYLGYNNSYRRVEKLQDDLVTLNNNIRNASGEKETASLVKARSRLRARIDSLKTQYHDSHGNFDISQAIKIDGNFEYKNFTEGKTSVYPMFIGKKELPVIRKKVSTPVYNSVMIIFMTLIVNIFTLSVLRIRFR